MYHKLTEENIAAIETALNKHGGAFRVEVKIENNKIVILRIDVKRVG